MDLAFDCKSPVCKGRNTNHRVRMVTDKLPPNVHVLECLACGILGVRSISDDMVNNL
jgi:hypothetical protein